MADKTSTSRRSDELTAFDVKLRRSHALPVLFVGSGFSRRYLGIPTWSDLLAHFAHEMGQEVEYFKGRTKDGLPGVATEIAKDFYDPWWKDKRYKASRDVSKHMVVKNADPLKIELASFVEDFAQTGDPELKDELSMLRESKVHAVVTTNWDRLLEASFPDFQVFVGQEDMVFAETQGVGEIYKIHGTTEQPTSLVLTSEDYEDFRAKNQYMAAKLLTMFAEHPIIFLGYSISDPHIQDILQALVQCLGSKHLQEFSERIIFVDRAKGGPSVFRPSPMNPGGRQLLIQELLTDDFIGIYEVLADLPRLFPPKLLRQLKREIYELAYTTEPSSRIAVVNMTEDTDLDKVQVVIGVGTHALLGKKGYDVYGRSDLVRSMLRASNTPSEVGPIGSSLIESVIPRVFAQANYSPIFYALQRADLIDSESGIITTFDSLPAKARALITRTTPLQPYFWPKGADKGCPFADLDGLDDPAIAEAGLLSTYRRPEDIEALRLFLSKVFEQVDNPTTPYHKLACLYDRVVFGQGVVTEYTSGE